MLTIEQIKLLNNLMVNLNNNKYLVMAERLL
jgi:hypothetical protein